MIFCVIEFCGMKAGTFLVGSYPVLVSVYFHENKLLSVEKKRTFNSIQQHKTNQINLTASGAEQ